VYPYVRCRLLTSHILFTSLIEHGTNVVTKNTYGTTTSKYKAVKRYYKILGMPWE